MAISINWIKDYVDLEDVNLEELALKITKAGINIEAVSNKAIHPLIIGEVLSCKEHPDSDHLHVCEVSLGDKTTQIVCGASNVKAGIKVIVALPGATLPGDFVIKESTIRGVPSKGMICALFELGLEEKNEETYNKGIAILEEDAPVGSDANKYLGLDDTTYTLDLNPNRFDCVNHIPFAYEAASVLGREVVLPSMKYKETNEEVKEELTIAIETPKCPLYTTKIVKNVKIGESPSFIKKRLEIAGIRSINNVVDISNYVMLEFGQPLHFFDQQKLGNKIVVRQAKEKEIIETLDHKQRELLATDIVITDGKVPVAIAGVMGGANSAISDETKNIVIESAIFDSLSIRYTSLRLDLRSEASLRYEHPLNYEYAYYAIERACHLLEKYAGGEVVSGTLVHDVIPKKERVVSVSLEEINRLLGMPLTMSDVHTSLNNLHFPYKEKDNIFTVTIPERRQDVELNKADIIEEVGRLYGYDKIEATLPKGSIRKGGYAPVVAFRKEVSRYLRSLGLNEARTYTLISDKEDALFTHDRHDSIALLKPLSEDKKILRQSLLPSLLKVVQYNSKHKVKNCFLYEIANIYYDEDKEEQLVAGILKGDYISSSWQQENTVRVDFYLVKGIIENLLNYLGFRNRYQFNEVEVDGLHPFISVTILVDREEIGYFGKIHPTLEKDSYCFSLSLSKLFAKKIKPIKMKEPLKYPTVEKDMAFIVKEEVRSGEIESLIKKAGGRLLGDVSVFDVYRGENVPEGTKAIAYHLVFEDQTRTLNEEEVMEVFHKIVTMVTTKMDAKLRDK